VAGAAPAGRAQQALPGAARLSPEAAALAPDPQTALDRYWTPRRMVEARPVDSGLSRSVATPERQTSTLGPIEVAPTRPRAAPPTAAPPRSEPTATPWPHRHDWASTTNGKVFFDSADGTPRVCSGVVVSTEARDTVLTAGHCVHTGRAGTWYLNWMFVPDYHDGDRPLGTWAARELWALSGWINDDDRGEDVGAAVMLPAGGRMLADVAGSQGIRVNGPDRPVVRHFGYPSSGRFDGQQLVSCAGPTSLRWTLWGDLMLPCDAQNGASGGAWLADFDGSSGYAVSVNSYHLGDDLAHIYGPHFGDGVYNLYQAVRHLR
jgi:V8-like Glu-specific endopeptidase